MAIRRRDGTWQVAKLPNGDWHPEEIKAAVRMSRRGLSLQKLSRDSGLHPHACSNAIHKPHYLGELAICGVLGVTPQEIWPSRHEPDGSRYCQIRQAHQATPAAAPGHCENREAA